MFYQLRYRTNPSTSVVIDVGYNRLTSSNIEKNGVIVRSSNFQHTDSRETVGKFAASDFSLDNILSIGAFDMLKSVVMTDTSNLNVADSIEKSIPTSNK